MKIYLQIKMAPFALLILMATSLSHLWANTVLVRTNPELLTALQNAAGGDTILLAPGNYGDLSISGYPNRTNFNYSDFVTIVSENSNNRAVFEKISVGFARYLRFDSIVLQHVKRTGEEDWYKAFYVRDTDYFQLLNSELHGSVDGNYDNDIYCLFTESSVSHLLVENNYFHDWTRGTIISGDHIIVRNNRYQGLRSDGADFAGVVDALVENNHFTDFHPCCGDHPDMIQFWNDHGTRTMRDVVVRNNKLFRGPGEWTQSIFIQSNNPAFPNQNFLIENNVIYNAHIHAISVSDTIGVTVQHNTILNFRRDPAELVPSINIYNTSSQAIVSNNVSTAYHFAIPVISENNITAQNGTSARDRALPTHYDNLFVNANSREVAVLDDFYPNPTSILIVNPGMDIGALEYNSHPENLTALILSDVAAGPAPLAVTFDGTLSGGPNAISTYEWNFGDGETASGNVVSHTFQEPNTYVVTLTVRDVNNQIDSVQKNIIVNPPPVTGLIFGLTFDGNILDYSGNHLPSEWTVNPNYVSGEYGQAAGFDGTSQGSYVTVPYHESQDGMNNLTIAFWARKQDRFLGGTTILKHLSYWFNVDDDEFSGYLFSEAGARVNFSAASSSIQNIDWHHYALTYDGTTVTVFIDGHQMNTRSMTGPIAIHQDREVAIGRVPWGNAFYGSMDDLKIYNIALSASEISSLAVRSPGNHPPFVNAGQNIVLRFPDARLNLNGDVFEDGLPNPPGQFSIEWSKASGLGQVMINNPNLLSTQAEFSSVGVYILRLTVSDGQYSVSDDIQVTVNEVSNEQSGITDTKFLVATDIQNPDHRQNPIITYQLKNPTHVVLEIFTPSGKKITTLVNQEEPAGVHTLQWDGRNESGDKVGSGVYVVVLDADGKKLKSKVVIIK
jgi:PKD repeat protein